MVTDLNTQRPAEALSTERVIVRAVDSPLVRGGLTIGAGIVTGNVLGFARVALTAYLLGTHSRADSLAVAVGPLDALNSVLINSVVFAFVPMFTARHGADRLALFRKLRRGFALVFSLLAMGNILFAPWLVRVLAPGLDPAFFSTSVIILRIVSLSTLAAGWAAIYSALLYTDRRFAPSAFYQASLNLFTVAGALSLWRSLGVYGFAIGYTVGAWVQFAVVYVAAAPARRAGNLPECSVRWREILAKPATIVIYALGLALNITFTRAWATQEGPGMAAALDYCMRGVGVPLAFLVSPLSNTLLPEIARLRSELRIGAAFRLINRTVALAALAAIGVCAFAIAFRTPVIALMFQRGSFTAESTLLVSAVFLGLGPSLVGWTLLELTSRSLFALDHRRLPVIAGAIPLAVNVALTLWMRAHQPQFLGVGASTGLLAGFVFLWLASGFRRKHWLQQNG